MMTAESVAGVSRQVVAQLRASIRRLEEGERSRKGRWFSSGCPALDRILPDAGFPAGILVEWLAAVEGSGAETLAFLAARAVVAGGGTLVILDRRQEFYPPAAAALGIDLQRTLVVRAARREEELWALDQALRCPGVGAVCVSVDRLDWRWFRRLQLAAEQGGGIGFLLRPAQVRGQPSWSHVQLWVQPRPSSGSRRLRVEVTRCLSAHPGRSVELEIGEEEGDLRAAEVGRVATCAVDPGSTVDGRHETHALSLAARLAQPTSYGARRGCRSGNVAAVSGMV